MLNLKFREGTIDKEVWENVFENNEYNLPNDLSGKVILDIGGHIGSFSAACKVRGASEIWLVEPDINSFNLALHNVNEVPGNCIFQPIHSAVWRSDIRGQRIGLKICGSENNTGGKQTFLYEPGDVEVPSIPFDHLIKLIANYKWGQRRVDLVKIDCEGAEWPILFSSKALFLVDKIIGEYHEGVISHFKNNEKIDGVEYSLTNLEKLLESNGLSTTIIRSDNKDFNLFFSSRK
jgi:FkbM family methyltransferase